MGLVRTAIYSFFTAATTSDLYSDLGGERLYYSEALETPEKPYCVFHIFDEIYDHTFDLDFEDVLIQFTYYGDTANEADSGLTNIKALFDYAELTISGYSCLRLEREYVIPPSKTQPDDLWDGIVRYSLLMQKN